MLGLQGEGWGTRDPFQCGDQEITYLQGALEGRGQARGSRIWDTDNQARPQLSIDVSLWGMERGDLSPHVLLFLGLLTHGQEHKAHHHG